MSRWHAQEVERPTRRRSSILGFGGSSARNLSSNALVASDEHILSDERDPMAGITAGYSATTLLTLTSLGTLAGVLVSRILS